MSDKNSADRTGAPLNAYVKLGTHQQDEVDPSPWVVAGKKGRKFICDIDTLIANQNKARRRLKAAEPGGIEAYQDLPWDDSCIKIYMPTEKERRLSAALNEFLNAKAEVDLWNGRLLRLFPDYHESDEEQERVQCKSKDQDHAQGGEVEWVQGHSQDQGCAQVEEKSETRQRKSAKRRERKKKKKKEREQQTQGGRST
ncbi:hypothetical protein F53441_3669 [Fusarium austroafricanum]|uniref:Uncharacterized protein n=1 Tax=Fusarium austroafricanum TaxID=2364996 RepID=A0A8H4NZN0_9HYPO|nr:hypothetical protein F53441_3669 [Fusarium austroafricanum]